MAVFTEVTEGEAAAFLEAYGLPAPDALTPIAEGIENQVLADMRRKTAELSARQVVFLARIEEAIRRIGININQSIRHIHQDHTAAFAEVRACHRLLQGLQRDVRRLLAS